MPPKKGKAKKAAVTKTPTRSTSTAAPATVVTNRGKEYDTTAAAARPRRAPVPPTQTYVPAFETIVKKKATATPATKKRGRPVKATEDAVEPPKKRGRPAKAIAVAKDEVEEDEEEEVAEPPKKRGRPSKSSAVTSKATSQKPAKTSAAPKAAAEPAKKRGRPAKATKAETEPADNESDDLKKSDAEPPKKRGRPSKQASAAPSKKEDVAAQPAKKGGRPFRTATEPAEAPAAPDTPAPRKRHSGVTGGPTTKIASDAADAADQLEEELIDEATKSAKKDGKHKVFSMDENGEENGKNYWLMKAEQVDRMETLKDGSQFNTKFTIDDLKAKDAPEPWEGVRNMVARNNMRAMKEGDLAFFYASQGKAPGITGIIEVVKEHEPDFTVDDESSVGYVEPAKRGKENQWSLVHVEFRKKLSEPVTLKQLQKYSSGNGVLKDMQVIKQSRLSVAKVSEKEWDFIVDNLIEGYEGDDDDDGLAGVKVTGPRPLNPNLNGGAAAELSDELPSEDDGLAGVKVTVPRPLNPNLNGGAAAELSMELHFEDDDLAADAAINGDHETNDPLTSDTALPLTTVATSRQTSRHESHPVSRSLSRAGSVSRQGSLAPPAIVKTEETITETFSTQAAQQGLTKPGSRAGSLKPASRASSRAPSLQPTARGSSLELSARPVSRGLSRASNSALMPSLMEEALVDEQAVVSRARAMADEMSMDFA